MPCCCCWLEPAAALLLNGPPRSKGLGADWAGVEGNTTRASMPEPAGTGADGRAAPAPASVAAVGAGPRLCPSSSAMPRRRAITCMWWVGGWVRGWVEWVCPEVAVWMGAWECEAQG